MPWNTITNADVLNEITPIEAALIQNQFGGTSGVAVNLAPILSKVINEARGMIKAGGNQVDQSAATVPDQLADALVRLARWRWIISLPQLKTMQTPDRKQAAADAEKRLANIASQDPHRERVELPANPDTTPAAVPLPHTGHPKRRRLRHEDGIV